MKREKTMKERRNAQGGFTLIELMIVIAIIGILAAVAIPNFLKARDKAQYSRCVETLSGVKVALEMYMTDYGKYPDNGATTTAAGGDWSDELCPYMIANCDDPTANQGAVGTRLVANCDNPTYTPAGAPPVYDYTLTGTAKDKCKISVEMCPAGYCWTNYQAAVITSGCTSAQCPAANTPCR